MFSGITLQFEKYYLAKNCLSKNKKKGKKDSSDLFEDHQSFYCFLRVAANPPSTLRTAKASGTTGVPVLCIPTVFLDVVCVVAAFASGVVCGIVCIVSELTPMVFKL